ncbi:MAG: RNB domain-containing ribonuclease [Polyangiales bacterium]
MTILAPVDLGAIAERVMHENGFSTALPDDARKELAALAGKKPDGEGARDLRSLPWSSIDNQESRELDQIEVADRVGNGGIRVRVAIADVDALVPAGSAIDRHAAENTSSVYTGARVFPMLPDALSTDATSLDERRARLAVVIEYTVAQDGTLGQEDVYASWVQNRAQLVYDDISAWLDAGKAPPAKIANDPVQQEQLRMQNEAAERLRKLRHEHGALDFETIEAHAVRRDGQVVGLEVAKKGSANALIEDFMIAANGVMARFLEKKGISSIRRVVRSPERWQRIVDLAAQHGTALPAEPSSVALSQFLDAQRKASPDTFGDLSLAVVKLMGPGEYALEKAGVEHIGHFGLAVHDYTHSTAPNRRYADLVTQRLVKAALHGQPVAYDDVALAAIAQRCTQKENDARKVERTMRKVLAATLLRDRIGAQFDAIVTGATPKGTFVRLLDPPAEGRVVRGDKGLDVGDRCRVTLLATEPAKGFIDFARA